MKKNKINNKVLELDKLKKEIKKLKKNKKKNYSLSWCF